MTKRAWIKILKQKTKKVQHVNVLFNWLRKKYKKLNKLSAMKILINSYCSRHLLRHSSCWTRHCSRWTSRTKGSRRLWRHNCERPSFFSRLRSLPFGDNIFLFVLVFCRRLRLNQVSIKFEKCLKKVFTVVYLEERNKTAKMF